MQHNTVALVLAGGVGSRLHPLTGERAKPAVPFGGKYRIIDFTLSNCLHSGLRRILVLTQYKSHSLSKHLRDAWSVFNPGIGEYITVVPPQMRTGASWYSGTADAVFQNLYLLRRSGAERVLILSGDHIYRMDYQALLRFHDDNRADATIACMKVPLSEASAFGVMAVEPAGRIHEFQEKPADPQPIPGDQDHALASMGVYVFSCELLCGLLEADAPRDDSAHDFGKDILPQLIHTHGVYGHEFGSDGGRVSADRYWRDVGSLDSFYAANMDLLLPKPPMDLYQRNWRVHGIEGQSPPARAVPGPSGQPAVINNALLGTGSQIAGGHVSNSILASDTRVGEGAVVSQSIIFDDVEVGPGALLNRCIVDKHVRIPAGTRIGVGEPGMDRFTVSEGGVVVVPQGYCFENASPPGAEVPSPHLRGRELPTAK